MRRTLLLSRATRLLLALAGALVAALLGSPQASAHAVVVGSDPLDSGRLARSPAAVTIRFDEPVGLDLGYLRVVDSSGHRVDSGSASHPGGDGTRIAVALRAGLGDGSYLASFRVISADSHPVAGSIRYVVGTGALGGVGREPGTAPVDEAVSVGLASAHWLSFTGVGVVGGSWLIFTVWPSGRRRPAVRRLIRTGWWLAVLGALAEFLLTGPYSAGTGPTSVFRSTLLDATLHENTGQLLSVRLVLLGVLGFVLAGLFAARRRSHWLPELAAIVGAGVVVTFAASGHAQSADPRWLAVLVDALHLAAMIVWLGGLVVLVTAAASRSTTELEADDAGDADELAAGLPVFSRLALVCVVVLAVTGTIQAWREIGVLDAVTATRYGQLVLVKIVLFAGLVGLGYLSRRALQRPRDGGAALGRIRRTIGVEVVVGAAVLAVTGVLISQPPGQVALAAERAAPRSATVAVTTSSSAVVQIDPGVHGNVQVSIRLTGSIRPTRVTASASLPAQKLGPIPLTLRADGANSYRASGVLLPAAGRWQVEVVVQTSEFDSTTALATVRVY